MTPSYYELPLLKPPVWTWEVPTYFFVGGAAGAAAAIGAAAQLTGADDSLVRDARWIAAAGSALSAPLLIFDLGRPERFLNMLRVFKPQSPMSVGVWTLTAFGAASNTAALATLVKRENLPVRVIGNVSSLSAAALGLVMASYTGVLIGVSSIPAWKRHVRILPVHFAASAFGAAIGMLELRGHNDEALNALGLGVALFETAARGMIETGHARESEPLRHGTTGIMLRAAGIMTGPLPFALRILGVRKAAAASSILGSLIARFAWVEAGKVSVRDVHTAM